LRFLCPVDELGRACIILGHLRMFLKAEGMDGRG
jgi:hypothetical protein